MLLPSCMLLLFNTFLLFLQINLRKYTYFANGKKALPGKRTSYEHPLLSEHETRTSRTSLSKSIPRLGEVDSIISPSQRFYFACSCVLIFSWFFLGNFAYLSLTLKSQSHQISCTMIGRDSRLVELSSSRKVNKARTSSHVLICVTSIPLRNW